MATATNPLLMSMVPGGGNPTGVNVAVPGAPKAPGVGTGIQANPFLPTTPTPGSASLLPQNPYIRTGGTGPTNPSASGFPANAGPYSPGSGSNFPSPIAPSTTGQTTQQLEKVFGPLAPFIQQLLSGGGGYSPQAVQAILAQMQPGIEAGQQNLMEEFGAQGGRFSSDAAIGLADYNSQVQLNEGEVISQLYEQSYQNYMNEILGLSGDSAQYEASKPSFWDTLSGILGLGAEGASLGIKAAALP